MAYTSTNFEAPQNRVSDALKLYAEQEAQVIIANPLAAGTDTDAITLKLNYYSGIHKKFKPDATPDEKLSLKYVEHQIENLKARLNPTPLNKLRYSKAGNSIRNFVSGYNLFFQKQDAIVNNLQKELIHNHNVKTLQSSFAEKGFSINMQSQLERMVELNLPEFHLMYLDTNKHNTLFQLHCKKIPDTSLYYFERFDAKANPALSELRSGVVTPQNKQTFDATETGGIKAQDAARLVHGQHIIQNNQCLYLERTIPGRSQELVTTEFNLDAELKKAKLPKLEQEQYHKMKTALRKGDSYQIKLPISGKGDVDCNIQYSPRNTNNKITVTDSTGNFINLNKFRKETLTVTKELANSITNDGFSFSDSIDWSPSPAETNGRNKKKIKH